MNRTNFQTIAIAIILGGITISSAQAVTNGSANADSAVEIRVVKRNLGGMTVIKETDDKVIIYKKERLQRDKDGNPLSKNGYGIAGGPVPGITALDFGPVNDLIHESKDLSQRTFGSMNRTNFEPIVTMGGMGYLGFGDGFRLGGGGMSGDRYYLSDAYAQDSIVSLKVSVQYGGFLVEKVHSHNRYHIITGTQIGGGSITVAVRRTVRAGNGVFDPEQVNNIGESKTADFFLLQLHGGFTYSIAPFMHVGADAMLPMFYSANGFEGYTSSFATINPSLRFRFMFGNL
jgi:hypothetical protein